MRRFIHQTQTGQEGSYYPEANGRGVGRLLEFINSIYQNISGPKA